MSKSIKFTPGAEGWRKIHFMCSQISVEPKALMMQLLDAGFNDIMLQLAEQQRLKEEAEAATPPPKDIKEAASNLEDQPDEPT